MDITAIFANKHNDAAIGSKCADSWVDAFIIIASLGGCAMMRCGSSSHSGNVVD